MTERDKVILDLKKFVQQEEKFKKENETRARQIKQEHEKKYKQIEKNEKGILLFNQAIKKRDESLNYLVLYKDTRNSLFFEDFKNLADEAIALFTQSYKECDYFKSSVFKDEFDNLYKNEVKGQNRYNKMTERKTNKINKSNQKNLYLSLFLGFNIIAVLLMVFLM